MRNKGEKRSCMHWQRVRNGKASAQRRGEVRTGSTAAARTRRTGRRASPGHRAVERRSARADRDRTFDADRRRARRVGGRSPAGGRWQRPGGRRACPARARDSGRGRRGQAFYVGGSSAESLFRSGGSLPGFAGSWAQPRWATETFLGVKRRVTIIWLSSEVVSL